MWIGQPILAVAGETEQIASDAIDLIKVDFEELPFGDFRFDGMTALHERTARN